MSDPTALPNFPPPPDEHPLRGRVLDVIQGPRLAPGDRRRRRRRLHGGRQSMFARCQDGDPLIMRVFGQWLIGDHVPDDLGPAPALQTTSPSAPSVPRPGCPATTSSSTSEHVITPRADLSVPSRSTSTSFSRPSPCGTARFERPQPQQAPTRNRPSNPMGGGRRQFVRLGRSRVASGRSAGPPETNALNRQNPGGDPMLRRPPPS